jgi:hypothetical protein
LIHITPLSEFLSLNDVSGIQGSRGRGSFYAVESGGGD